MTHPDDVVVDLPAEPNLERILAVEGEVVAHGEAAARAERHVVTETHVLFEQPGHPVGDGGRRLAEGGVADRLTADLARRGEVALEVRGGEREAGGDVVEAFVGFIGQQQG